MLLVSSTLFLVTNFLFGASSAQYSTDPVVTLSHGGQLRGTTRDYNNHQVDLFLGIRYAQPPTGDLRFKKPQELRPWQGEVNAQAIGNICTQISVSTRELIGNEDCLFLDITIPRGFQTNGSSKAVMVWIHGGGFILGAGSGYIGAPLATTGDVIVVSINYRLGIFGFLSDGEGTGNFGLWDQREAVLWVKRNIASFGGDPDNITITGESAGSASVAAQTVSPHNDNTLFRRAIQQSGSLFLPWAWYQSRKDQQEKITAIRNSTACTMPGKVYDCYKGLSTLEVINSFIVPDPLDASWHPLPDKDFFPDDFETNPNYELSKRFDLLSGMNGQEGAVDYTFHYMAFTFKVNGIELSEGVSLNLAREFLKELCADRLAQQSPNLCADFLITTYRLDSTKSDRGRAVRLSYTWGDTRNNVDIVNQLRQHASDSYSSGSSTYAYYFNENYTPILPTVISSLPIPRWLKRSAFHQEELPFLFGGTEDLSDWMDLLSADGLTASLFNQTLSRRYRDLSTDMMNMWTNFAKTGNPNSPAKLSSRVSEWPEFTIHDQKFLEVTRRRSRPVPTPNGGRLQKLQDVVLADRAIQLVDELKGL